MINLTLPDIKGLPLEDAVQVLQEYLYELADQVQKELTTISDEATVSTGIGNDVAALKLSVSRLSSGLSDEAQSAVKKGNVISSINASTEAVDIDGSKVRQERVSGAQEALYEVQNYDASDVTRVQAIVAGDTPTEAELEKYDLTRRGYITELDQDIVNAMVAESADAVVRWSEGVSPEGGHYTEVSYTVNGTTTTYKCKMHAEGTDAARANINLLKLYDSTDDEWFVVDAHALKLLL